MMNELSTACRKSLAAIARQHNLMFEYEQISWLAPVACHPNIIELIERHAERSEMSFERMSSGAGHDAQFLAQITRAGMIFVPSIGGVSHAPDEWTHWHDVEAGANQHHQIWTREINPFVFTQFRSTAHGSILAVIRARCRWDPAPAAMKTRRC